MTNINNNQMTFIKCYSSGIYAYFDGCTISKDFKKKPSLIISIKNLLRIL